MQQVTQFVSRHKRLVIAGIIILVGFLIFTSLGTKVQDPSKNKLEDDPRAGRDYAILYQQGNLYDFIDESDSNLMLIQKDLVTFIRETDPKFKDDEKLIGFTFDKRFDKKDKEAFFTGYFYSLKDKIQLKVNLLGNGVIRLSVTNLKTKANVDKKLNLNGVKNTLLDTLPVDKDYYSVRYLNSTDEVVVTFYEGYSQQDIDGALGILKKAYGQSFKEDDFTYNINGLGIFTLDQVVQNLEQPITND